MSSARWLSKGPEMPQITCRCWMCRTSKPMPRPYVMGYPCDLQNVRSPARQPILTDPRIAPKISQINAYFSRSTRAWVTRQRV